MPIYEYRCNDCRSTFEVLRRMGQRELSAVCPRCESGASMPLISRVFASRTAVAGGGVATAPRPAGGCCGGGCACG